MAITNGHVSEDDDERLKPSPAPQRSESELSDLNDLPTAQHNGQDDTSADDEVDDTMHDMATSELDDDEDAPGEADADFDKETPPLQDADGMPHDRSLSEDSLRPGRRKPDLDDEEYMKENPELYGLRRSVSVSNPA